MFSQEIIHLNVATELNAILDTASLHLAIIVRSLFGRTHSVDGIKFQEFVTVTLVFDNKPACK
jgi:hypothetical protein